MGFTSFLVFVMWNIGGLDIHVNCGCWGRRFHLILTLMMEGK